MRIFILFLFRFKWWFTRWNYGNCINDRISWFIISILSYIRPIITQIHLTFILYFPFKLPYSRKRSHWFNVTSQKQFRQSWNSSDPNPTLQQLLFLSAYFLCWYCGVTLSVIRAFESFLLHCHLCRAEQNLCFCSERVM